MIEIHSKMFCRCGQRYYGMMATTLPLSRNISMESLCPSCGNVNIAEFEFEIDYNCGKWYKPWEKHYVDSHFTKNEGEMELEIYPRLCKCGGKIHVKQRRIK